eukprot:GFUD01009491.1.p1 GENE.GFUD01009491.1~~GFUD01009491.1.p1  ORF type:complete len:417 (+),score=140.18 GFUD01009491.1:36-1286(+)
MSRLLHSVARCVCHSSPSRHITTIPSSPIRHITSLTPVSRCSSHPAGCSAILVKPCRARQLPARRTVTTANCQQAAADLSTTSCSQGADAFSLVESSLGGMLEEIHMELRAQLVLDTEMGEIARYYFDGGGKAVRPCIALCVGQLANCHNENIEEQGDRVRRQKQVAIVSEMIHTASLVHDDILDHAETRRGKESVNVKWDTRRSTMAGDYILAVGSRLLSQVGDKEVVVILSQVLADLVQGEFMQLQNKEDESERFEHYLTKSFNKTASLMAYSCRANAVLAGVSSTMVEHAFQYGRNIGIAFQLVDDLLDFIVSADQLGKPAAADLKLGLATAPVLFAAEKFPELNEMIGRRFEEEGDVERAFQLVQESGGLEETKELAKKHCEAAIAALEHFADSEYKTALVDMCDKVLNRMK